MRIKKLFWLKGGNGGPSIDNECLIYIVIFRPVWTYRFNCEVVQNQ